jgi:hypothetical protein
LSIVVYWFIAAEVCLPFHCLAMAACSCSTIPAFSHHVTICWRDGFKNSICISINVHNGIILYAFDKNMIHINEYKNIFLLYALLHLQCRFWYEWKGSEIVFISLYFH